MDLQPKEGSWPPAVDTLPLRGYTHEMTLSRSSLAGMESYNTARCVCQPEVKGQSGTNDHGLGSSLLEQYEVAAVHFGASGNS